MTVPPDDAVAACRAALLKACRHHPEYPDDPFVQVDDVVTWCGTVFDVVGTAYAALTDEWLRPTTKAGMLARLEGIAKDLEDVLRWGGRDPRAYLLPRTRAALAAAREAPHE